MKIFSLFIFLFSVTFSAQTTKSTAVTGDIIQPVTIRFDDLRNYRKYTVDSLVIYNHKMEYKSTLQKISGVSLKDVLEKVGFKTKFPKQLSEFYIVCIADDGYKVVFSWNEIFNSASGNQALLVTELNGSPAATLKENIMLVTPTDRATGRRYVKNMSTMIIQQVK